MILGIGTDLVNIHRIEKLISKFGLKFYNKIFSSSELEKFTDFAKNKDMKITSFCAKKFAAKEAFVKATGTGIGRGVNFNDITIGNNNLGKPIIELSERAQKFLEGNYKKKMKEICIHVSISDDYPFAHAMVTISC